MTVPSVTRFKTCTKCGVTYPAQRAFFQRHPRGGLGFWASCKTCERLRIRADRLAKPEVYKARSKSQYAKHKEKRNAESRAYYWENRDEQLERLRRYREANRQYFRRWKKENTEKRRQAKQTRIARKAGALGSHTQEEVWQMLESQTHLCCYCEVPLFGFFHVEHMTPLSRGGSDDWTNLGISCGPCNTSKGSKTAVEFVNLKMFGVHLR